MLIPLRSLHTYIFLRSSLSLSRETYSIGLSIFFRFHSPVRYTISRYLIAHMISGSSTSRRNTRTRPLLYPEHSLPPLRSSSTGQEVTRSLLLGFSLTISITRMTEWASKSQRDNLYCNYNKALCAEIHGGRRSHFGWDLHSPRISIFHHLCVYIRFSLSLHFKSISFDREKFSRICVCGAWYHNFMIIPLISCSSDFRLR